MSVVSSVYIRHVEKHINADYILKVFSSNDIAKVGKVVFEAYKKTNKNKQLYKHAYVEIENWHDTEAAYNFIKRLQNPQKETRIIHNDDNWWLVEVNKYSAKLDKKNRTELSNILSESHNYGIKIDLEKTILLKNIISNFTKANFEDVTDLDSYMKEVDSKRKEWYDNNRNN
jgi:hypothetical protein